MTTVTKVTKENIATMPRSGRAHEGIALASCLCFSVARDRKDSLESYFRPTTDGAQGSDGVVLAGGVVVTVVAITVQHVALLHSPFVQGIPSSFFEKPRGQVKLWHVGTGVVVTVVCGDVFSTQHIDLSQGLSPHSIDVSFDFQPSGHSKSPHVGAGVVVTVVTTALQHVDLLHPPFKQATSPSFLANPWGQVKALQVGAGVVVTVVHGDTYSSQQLDFSHVLAGQASVCFLFFHP